MFKIGIGPSSSHTLGPWRAALRFIQGLESRKLLQEVAALQVLLYGSLAKTGKGHGTDIAVILGLCGEDPVTFDVNALTPRIESISYRQEMRFAGQYDIRFNPAEDVVFLKSESLPFHPNALTFLCTLNDGQQVAETYYSIGGGFVIKDGEDSSFAEIIELKYPIEKAEDLLRWCTDSGLTISEVVQQNELAWRPNAETREGVLNIWKVMRECIYRGVHTTGKLPGGLEVTRRAASLNQRLLKDRRYQNFDEWIDALRAGGQNFQYILDCVSCFALAVNEENAAFGRVVTAPTNGAAGVIPAVLLYYCVFCEGSLDDDKIIRFLLNASEIGSIFKKGATLSAAMGGCQAEIGVSSSMAASALTECLGGTVEQCMQAAEIAMEHHLGMTCDPVAGLVQVPCIERNTMGAIKAITASQLALQSNPGEARVSLDAVVDTMWQTALDMDSKYKETAEAGLATHIPLSLPEC